MRFTGYILYSFFFFLVISGCNNQPATTTPGQIQPKKTRVIAREPFDRHGHLIFTRHARCRMDCRHITKREIHEVLDSGTINYAKSELHSKPDPKYAVEAYTEEHQHLRIVIAPSGEELIVITCIELGVEWQCHCN